MLKLFTWRSSKKKMQYKLEMFKMYDFRELQLSGFILSKISIPYVSHISYISCIFICSAAERTAGLILYNTKMQSLIKNVS